MGITEYLEFGDMKKVVFYIKFQNISSQNFLYNQPSKNIACLIYLIIILIKNNEQYWQGYDSIYHNVSVVCFLGAIREAAHVSVHVSWLCSRIRAKPAGLPLPLSHDWSMHR